MNLFGRDLSHDIAIVGEVGVNHEGDEAKAAFLIEAIAAAGADAIKLQTYTPERLTSADDSERLARVTRFALSLDAHRRLAEMAHRKGIRLFSTAVTEDVVPFLSELFPVIKIASGDLDFEPLVRSAAATGKPIILSTGNGTLEEIDAAVGWCRESMGAEVLRDRLVLMHCVSAYPAPMEEANLLSIPFLKQRYGLVTGYSNHVVGPEAPLAAVALGAQVVEIHVTDNKHGRQFRDHALSFEPQEVAALVNSARAIRRGLGTPGKDLQLSERSIRAAMRKGIAAARDIDAGTVLNATELMFTRPATEFAASEISVLIGRTLTRAVRRGHLIPRNAVAPSLPKQS